MLRNARDAHARNIFLAISREADTRRITMIDDGDGIPEHLVKRIFDARVTSKLDSIHIDTWGVHGRGMALYAVRLNSKKAFVAATKLEGGSSFVVETDTSVLPEKSDQSSMPVFIRNDSGRIVVRGTRNINRTVAEFAYVDRENCTVYLGSPVEIAATLWDFGCLLLPGSTRAFLDNADELEVCKRLAIASSPENFSSIAASIGLELSARSARRIMDGEVHGLPSLADTISIAGASKPRKKKARGAQDIVGLKDARGMHLNAEDKELLKCTVHDAFASIAQSYYLNPDVDVTVHTRKDSISIRIPIDKQ